MRSIENWHASAVELIWHPCSNFPLSIRIPCSSTANIAGLWYSSFGFLAVTVTLLWLHRTAYISARLAGGLHILILIPCIVVAQGCTGGINSPFNVPPIGTLQVCAVALLLWHTFFFTADNGEMSIFEWCSHAIMFLCTSQFSLMFGGKPLAILTSAVYLAMSTGAAALEHADMLPDSFVSNSNTVMLIRNVYYVALVISFIEVRQSACSGPP
jgi:hypothetical protein